MPGTYLEALPATPGQLYRQNPEIATRVFSAVNPPVQCPLSKTAIAALKCKVNMRGGSKTETLQATVQGLDASLWV